MAYTANDVINQAVERNSLNSRDLMPDAEARDYISSASRRAFLQAAAANPDYFGEETTTTRSSSTNPWDLDIDPGTVGAITRVEISGITGTVSGLSSGDKVNVVSIEFPDVEVDPRCYIRGRKIREYDGELSTDASNYVDDLKVFYSKLPTRIVSNTQAVALPEEWVDLVVLPLARIYALRDGRRQEAQLLQQEYEFAFQQFVQHVQVYNSATSNPLRNRTAPAMGVGGQGEQ